MLCDFKEEDVMDTSREMLSLLPEAKRIQTQRVLLLLTPSLSVQLVVVVEISIESDLRNVDILA